MRHGYLLFWQPPFTVPARWSTPHPTPRPWVNPSKRPYFARERPVGCYRRLSRFVRNVSRSCVVGPGPRFVAPSCNVGHRLTTRSAAGDDVGYSVRTSFRRERPVFRVPYLARVQRPYAAHHPGNGPRVLWIAQRGPGRRSWSRVAVVRGIRGILIANGAPLRKPNVIGACRPTITTTRTATPINATNAYSVSSIGSGGNTAVVGSGVPGLDLPPGSGVCLLIHERPPGRPPIRARCAPCGVTTRIRRRHCCGLRVYATTEHP